MLCLRPLCGIVFGPVAMTAGGAAFLGTLAALALAACAAAGPGRPREEEGAERPAGGLNPRAADGAGGAPSEQGRGIETEIRRGTRRGLASPVAWWPATISGSRSNALTR